MSYHERSEADEVIERELPKGMAEPLDVEILMGSPQTTDPAATLPTEGAMT